MKLTPSRVVLRGGAASFVLKHNPSQPCGQVLAYPAVDAVAVVVNVRTDPVTTVAVASILTHTDLPVVLVDCGTDTPPEPRFAGVLNQWPGRVTVITEPLMSHGLLLDRLFRTLTADIIFCVDSDAELLTDQLVPTMTEAFDNPAVFGAGYTNGPDWIGPQDGVKDNIAYFQERPWMPFVALRKTHVIAALDAGTSFAASTWWNDLPASQTISRHLAKRFQDGLSPPANLLWRIRPLRGHLGWRLGWLKWVRRDFNGHRPNYVYYDTGAAIYQWCKHTAGLLFNGTDYTSSTRNVHHHTGVTRHTLTGSRQHATAYADIATDIEQRLTTYGL